MITPILLCGGSGTRLWPLSRKSFPKQFADILGEQSLFQASALRFVGPGFADPLVITGNEFRFIVTEQLAECGVQASGIMIEPEGRNTAPAAIAAALQVAASNPEGLILLVPSDHAVADPAAFRAAVAQGLPAAEAGQIVTFGIQPSRAETGYGWLEAGAVTHPGVHHLNRFIEKPNAARAAELFDAPHNLWNAGVFLAKATVLIAAFAEHAPAILAGVKAALAGAVADLGFTRIEAKAWAKVPEDSIDYA
ncbi:mannose-1-phosphate guanylyltransferase, partial [Cypionkella sp.]|uniref:mannose-1-phosphate guanylyltransferase n=1 Tax=Cypionkella sp. TaxID=2811411 RepID=UPI002ABAB5FB